MKVLLVAFRLWKISVDLFSIQASHECDFVFVERNSNAIVTELDSIVIPLRFKLFEIGNCSQILSGLNDLDQLCDSFENRFALD